MGGTSTVWPSAWQMLAEGWRRLKLRSGGHLVRSSGEATAPRQSSHRIHAATALQRRLNSYRVFPWAQSGKTRSQFTIEVKVANSSCVERLVFRAARCMHIASGGFPALCTARRALIQIAGCLRRTQHLVKWWRLSRRNVSLSLVGGRCTHSF